MVLALVRSALKRATPSRVGAVPLQVPSVALQAAAHGPRARRSHRPASARARSQAGFTLIEMLTVIMCIGILAGISIASYNLYRANAAYAAVQSTLRNARTAVESSLARADNPPAAVAYTGTAMTPALFSANSPARSYLEGFTFGDNMKVRTQYDPACADGGCVSDLLEVRHCTGKEFLRWFRMGDGTEVEVPRVPGEGCP
jgi:prepilin-type N-terminal cleavage/methylation domain-containing protein